MEFVVRSKRIRNNFRDIGIDSQSLEAKKLNEKFTIICSSMYSIIIIMGCISCTVGVYIRYWQKKFREQVCNIVAFVPDLADKSCHF